MNPRKPPAGELAACAARGEWATYVMLHEKPDRVHALAEIRDQADPGTFAEVAALAWGCVEHTASDAELWGELLAAAAEHPERFMTDVEREVLDGLDDQVTVYRGVRVCAEEDRGLSWTLDREAAAWYARRYFADGAILVGTVPRGRIIAFFEADSEIVVPRQHVTLDEAEPIG